MKAILVMDMPKRCVDCNLAAQTFDPNMAKYIECTALEKRICDSWLDIWSDDNVRPDWCPLRPLPDYKPEPDRAGWTNGEPITEELTDWLMDFGFNCCLEAITGGTYDKTQDD